MSIAAVFSVDAESLGLYGDIFAVGVSVRECDTNKEIDSLYVGCPLATVDGYRPDHPSIKWLEEHVLCVLPPPTCTTAREMRDQFWAFYEKWKAAGATFVADCGVPVEANLFRRCVLDDEKTRCFQAPYPLHELGTLLLAHGKDPIGTYPRKPDELPAHHPLNDARQSGRQWIELQ